MSGGLQTATGSSTAVAHMPLQPVVSDKPVTPLTVSLKRRSPGSILPSMTPTTTTVSSSFSSALITVVEKSILRSMSFVLYHLDRDQAQYCVSSILQWYWHLQTQLPLFAADPLEKFATSFVALSDAEFTTFWHSLLEQEDVTKGDEALRDAHRATLHHDSDVASTAVVPCDTLVAIENDTRLSPSPSTIVEETTLVRRLYEQILRRIWRVFQVPSCLVKRNGWCTAAQQTQPRHTQTPLTSPDDKYDESHYRRQTADAVEDEMESDNHAMGIIPLEPGWAVQYMEQECMVSTEMTRRMRKMMHTSIPLNLFRVAVSYGSEHSALDDEETDSHGFVGAVSPESFPPTPITRDLQTRRMHHYTVTVLDHATLALRLLETS